MVEIRDGNPDDGDRLTEIQAAVLAEAWPELLEAALSGLPPLYVVGREPMGYAIVIPGSEDAAYLPELAIAPEHQGEGYGSALLERVATELREADYEELRLTVRVDDTAVREFYRDHDFEQIKRLPDHFEDCDGLLLARELS